MKKESEYIDQLFRENQYRFDRQPSARVWRRLEDRLDTQKPHKSKRKTIQMNWMIAASTLFLMLLPAYFLLHYWHKPWNKEMASADSATISTPVHFSASQDSPLPASDRPSFAPAAESDSHPASPIRTSHVPPESHTPKPASSAVSVTKINEISATSLERDIPNEGLTYTTRVLPSEAQNEDNFQVLVNDEKRIFTSSPQLSTPDLALLTDSITNMNGEFISLSPYPYNDRSMAEIIEDKTNKRRGDSNADAVTPFSTYHRLHCQVSQGIMQLSLTYPDGHVRNYMGKEINGLWLLSNTLDGNEKLEVSVINTQEIALFFYENPAIGGANNGPHIYKKKP